MLRYLRIAAEIFGFRWENDIDELTVTLPHWFSVALTGLCAIVLGWGWPRFSLPSLFVGATVFCPGLGIVAALLR